jgi:hypothetical protein
MDCHTRIQFVDILAFTFPATSLARCPNSGGYRRAEEPSEGFTAKLDRTASAAFRSSTRLPLMVRIAHAPPGHVGEREATIWVTASVLQQAKQE